MSNIPLPTGADHIGFNHLDHLSEQPGYHTVIGSAVQVRAERVTQQCPRFGGIGEFRGVFPGTLEIGVAPKI